MQEEGGAGRAEGVRRSARGEEGKREGKKEEGREEGGRVGGGGWS